MASVFLALLLQGCSAPEPYGALPTDYQVQWQKMDRNMFIHFGPNTFSGREWGDGKEPEDLFNPTDLDCRQWARVARSAGFQGIIITAKHHDGFCLWPNPVSNHTVAQSSWMDGKGDVLRELSEACREYGLKFGVYISPWDRNDPHYGTPEYNDVFVKTLQSALSSYGPVFEQWFDGANGEGPNGKRQVYDWPLFHKTVWELQPQAIMFSDVGPGCRWVGNEQGRAGRTSWSTLNVEGYEPGSAAPPQDTLTLGNVHGGAWVAPETDVSIRPGWFWKESENGRVKSLNRLLKIYYESTGRNSLMLLNVPPDTRGHIHEIDSVRLGEFGEALSRIFSVNLAEGASAEASSSFSRRYSPSNVLDGNYDSFWTSSKDSKDATLTLALPGEKTFNRVDIGEYIPLGQRIYAFTVEVLTPEGIWKEVAKETTVGFRRIVLLDEAVTTSKIRLSFSAYAPVTINKVALYMDDIYVKENERSTPFITKLATDPVTVDLGGAKRISSFTFVPAERGQGGVIIDWTLQGSLDGKNWEDIIAEGTFDNIVNSPTDRTIDLPSPTWARHLRLVPRRTSNGVTYSVSSMSAK